MKFSSFALAVTASLPFASAVRNGFNIAATKEGGACLTEHDWQHYFKTMKKFPGKFNHARVYASSDCNTLVNAVPAAKRTGVKLLAGVWSTPPDHYAAEKAAFQQAISQHGTGWLSGVSVGSEDLYRGDISASSLAGQVNEIRGMLHGVKGGKDVPIGHVDTWTEWVHPSSKSLIHAVDFLGMDGYPYYQNKTINSSKKVFYRSLARTKHAAKGKPVWVTETMWPHAGPAMGPAKPSKKNARHYWKHTMCKLFKTHNTFAFQIQDYWVTSPIPSFGVLDKHNKLIFNLHC